VIGEIWKQRKRSFLKMICRVDNDEIFSLTQLKMWDWIKNKEKLIDFTYLQWCIEPKKCLKFLERSKYRKCKLGMRMDFKTVSFV